jgi:hypothetical protein
MRATQLKIHAKLRVFGHLGLVEQHGFRRVDARGDEPRRDLARVVDQLGWRHQPRGDRVQVDHAVKRLEIARILHAHGRFDHAEVIAKRQPARGLDAGKDAGGEGGVCHVSGAS